MNDMAARIEGRRLARQKAKQEAGKPQTRGSCCDGLNVLERDSIGNRASTGRWKMVRRTTVQLCEHTVSLFSTTYCRGPDTRRTKDTFNALVVRVEPNYSRVGGNKRNSGKCGNEYDESGRHTLLVEARTMIMKQDVGS